MSSTASSAIPRHIAIIMDGNGRWAAAKRLPRAAGHRAGVKALRAIIEHCIRRQVSAVTVFAFSSENWRRPRKEVDLLLDLFMESLDKQVAALNDNGVCLRFAGDRDAFPAKLRKAVQRAEELTANNTRLRLQVAANYGGRWDIARACRDIAGQAVAGGLDPAGVDEALFSRHLSFFPLEEPDLLVRTGGEQRISNFLLWELAYTELYFTDVLWPDFDGNAMDEALSWYAGRQRRFGRTSNQLRKSGNAPT